MRIRAKSETRTPMLFCERAFGGFFLLWGSCLISDYIFLDSTRGMLFGQLEKYMPGWAWGILLVTIGLLRWLAHRRKSRWYRVALSGITFIILTIVAALATYTGLWNATAPLAAFTAYISFWCHVAMLRDTHLDSH